MAGKILQGICVVLLWVGMWGLAEIGVDKVAQNSIKLRILIYVILILLSILLLWLLGVEI